MRQLLIGDCHFGVYSNSVNWLEKQLQFFNTQVREVLDTKSIDRVVFLGDLFDIRYSVNQQVGIEVKNLIRDLLTQYSNIDFYFIAGNHDFYSPLEEFHNYNVYNIVFGKEFENTYKNCKFIIYDNYFDEMTGDLFLPWYTTEDPQKIEIELFKIRENGFEVKNIFCHADLQHWDTAYKTVVDKTIQVWSGHIHFIWDVNNFHNIGAMFSFTFNDVNAYRYMYILNDNSCVEKIENKTTPKFKQYANEEIFKLTEDDFNNAYVRLYIFNSNINKAKYIEHIKFIKQNFAEYNVKIQTIDDSLGENFELTYFNTNIENYISNNIPDYLINKYNYVKEKLKKKEVGD